MDDERKLISVLQYVSHLTRLSSLVLQTVQAHRPHFVAVHCQEVGGKNYEASMAHVDSFIK